MSQNINELKVLIIKKNQILKCALNDDSRDSEKIKLIERELDGLLYQYIKQLKMKDKCVN